MIYTTPHSGGLLGAVIDRLLGDMALPEVCQANCKIPKGRSPR